MLFHSLNGYSDQHWAKPKPVQELQAQLVTHVGGRSPNVWAIICYFPQAHWRRAGSEVEQQGMNQYSE